MPDLIKNNYNYKLSKEELKKLMEGLLIPISIIEKEAGLPQNSLQRALKGDRGFSRKWTYTLQEYVKVKKEQKDKPFIFDAFYLKGNKIEKKNIGINKIIEEKKLDEKMSYEPSVVKKIIRENRFSKYLFEKKLKG